MTRKKKKRRREEEKKGEEGKKERKKKKKKKTKEKEKEKRRAKREKNVSQRKCSVCVLISSPCKVCAFSVFFRGDGMAPLVEHQLESQRPEVQTPSGAQ